MNFIDLLNLASTQSTTAANDPKRFVSLGLIVVLFVVMYFLMIRPQKKKQKEEQDLRDAIQIGDEIMTYGGILGRVVSVKDDALVIETGSDRVKLKISRMAVQTNETAQARLEAEKKAAEDAKKEYQNSLAKDNDRRSKAKHEEILTKHEKRQRAKEDKINSKNED